MKSHIKPLMADPYGVPTGVVPRVFAPIVPVELHDHETIAPAPTKDHRTSTAGLCRLLKLPSNATRAVLTLSQDAPPTVEVTMILPLFSLEPDTQKFVVHLEPLP